MNPVAPELTFVTYNTDYSIEPQTAAPLASDASVADVAQIVRLALEARGWPCVMVPLRDGVGPLLRQVGSMRAAAVFNLVESLGGDAGREAEVPEALQREGICFTGNGPAALRRSLDKGGVRRILAAKGVRVARGGVVRDSSAAATLVGRRRLEFPLFVKPARLDASIAVTQASYVRDVGELRRQVDALVAASVGGVVVEEFLPGPEINVAVWPGSTGSTVATSCIDFSGFREELIRVVTYDCKWVEDSEEYCARSVAATEILDETSIAAAVQMARRGLTALGVHGYARVDLRFDATGAPCVMDINPNPDLHPDAGFASSLAVIGHDYATVVEGILIAAKELHNDRVSSNRRPGPRAARGLAAGHARVQR